MRLVLIAMEAEARALDLVATFEPDHFTLFGTDIHVIMTGIGKVNAATALERMCALHQVESVFNIGFAGAPPPYRTGDVVIVEDARYHDFDLSVFGYAKGQVPGFPESYQSDPDLVRDARIKLPSAKSGTLLTGDSFMTESPGGACLADMEGAAIAQTAHRHGIPLLMVKVVSDVIGSSDHASSYEHFEKNDQGQSVRCVINTLFHDM
jgi:adenosylhomocysteine nucleosidase